MSKREAQYDVCLSFAGEDRDYVEQVAAHLASLGVTVFYDRYEQTNLWGKDLYTHLDDIYRKKARYCVMFISKHYRRKLWTNHERRSAQAHAFESNSEYILPARFDNTDIAGILPTVGYISLKGLTPEAFASVIKSKLEGKAKTKSTVKRPSEFRRIYFEGFDYLQLRQKDAKQLLGHLWLIGKKGPWLGTVTAGEYHLSNLQKPDASLNNKIRYFEPADHQIDLGDCRASVRVRTEPPNDAHSGAGLLFRASDDGTAYYAFILHPGSSVSLAEMRMGKLSFLWSQEIPRIAANTFVTLKAVGEGKMITFYVNDSPIYTKTDSTLLNGSVGVMALSIGKYIFDDFSIYLRLENRI